MGKKSISLDPSDLTGKLQETTIVIPAYMLEAVAAAAKGAKPGEELSGALENAGFGKDDVVALALGGIFTVGFDLITVLGGPQNADAFVKRLRGN